MTSAQSLYTSRIREYLSRLERGDAAAICELFAPDAQVHSPLVGCVSPRPFFEELSRHRDRAPSRRGYPARHCLIIETA